MYASLLSVLLPGWLQADYLAAQTRCAAHVALRSADSASSSFVGSCFSLWSMGMLLILELLLLLEQLFDHALHLNHLPAVGFTLLLKCEDCIMCSARYSWLMARKLAVITAAGRQASCPKQPTDKERRCLTSRDTTCAESCRLALFSPSTDSSGRVESWPLATQ